LLTCGRIEGADRYEVSVVSLAAPPVEAPISVG
jgi:hypothetical protein